MQCIGGRARARVLDTMPTAHLPTPANLPNLNAKSAVAPSVRGSTREPELGRGVCNGENWAQREVAGRVNGRW